MRIKEGILLLMLCGGLAHGLIGQTPAPEFEAVSIKPAPKLTMAMMNAHQWHSRMDNAVFDESNITTMDLITMAYHVNAERVTGPGWLSDETFAVAAKLPAGATKEQVPAMLQKVLADRFKLALHHDRKVQPVYLLTIGKDGVKFKESTGDGDPAMKGCNGRPGRYRCMATTIEQMAENFSNMAPMYARMPATDQRNIDLPVVDQTGLKGIYDIDLQWIPPQGVGPGRRGAILPPPDPDTKATSIFGALEAVGLKLQAGKYAFDYLIIDHVERTPSEN